MIEVLHIRSSLIIEGASELEEFTNSRAITYAVEAKVRERTVTLLGLD